MAVTHTFLQAPGMIDDPGVLVTKDLTPIRAIKAHCLECFSWKRDEVEKCTSPHCALYPFRLGKAGRAPRELTDDQRDALRKRSTTCSRSPKPSLASGEIAEN